MQEGESLTTHGSYDHEDPASLFEADVARAIFDVCHEEAAAFSYTWD